jgi:hypothetical protein
MSKFSRRSTRGLALSSSLLLSSLLGACEANPTVTEPGAVSAPATPEGSKDQPDALSPSALQTSSSADRANARTLEGSTLSGEVAIFLDLSADTGVEKVEFFLDDSTQQGPAQSTATRAPFDFVGTDMASEAALFDTWWLPDGKHTVTAVVTSRDRQPRSVTAHFTVANGEQMGPMPDPEEEAELPEETASPTEAPSQDPSAQLPPMPGTDTTSSTDSPLVTGSAISPSTPLPTPTGLRSVAAWETLFLKRWAYDHTDFLARSTSADSWLFYNLGYGIDGNTAMYRATGKTQYLERALLYVENMVKTARFSSTLTGSRYKDSYLGWVSKRDSTFNQEIPLYESYCWRYVTRLLRVIRETPELYNNATYRARYDKLLAFTEKNIFEKWHRRGANSNIYRSTTHMAAHWAYIAMDLSRMTTDTTRKATYLAVFNDINRDLPNSTSSLRQQMRPHPLNAAGYFWSNLWGSTARPGQDVSHGNGVMAYIVEARDAGMEWTDKDVRAFVTTLNSAIWRSAGKYADYVDGSGTGNGWFNDGMMKLGRYDAALQRRLETHTVGNNTQFFGNGALNVRLLSEAAAARRQ